VTLAGQSQGGNTDSPLESIEQLGADQATVDREHDELRRHVEQLEAELERYRSQDHLMSKALLAATAFAVRLREDARREAEAALQKANAKARARVAKAERERRQAEREILRLRKLAEQARGGLSVFLTTTLSHLEVEERFDEEKLQDPVETDTASEPVPKVAAARGGIEYRSAPAERAADAEPDTP
jgi:cell division septum initiation protein DivIVA